MKTKTIPFLLLFCLPLAAAAQTPLNFDDLAALTPYTVNETDLPGLELPADKKWGVTYSLKGVVSVNDGTPYINTTDGRVFQLDLSARKARKFDGKTVKVEALARQADDLSVLKVDSIKAYTPSAGEVVPPPYQPRRRQAALLSERDGLLVMDNVRYMPGDRPDAAKFDWTTASLKPELIKNVYFIKKPFAPELVAAHSFLVFTFEKGGYIDGNGKEPMGLALSIEGRTRVNQSFSPLTGLMNKFGIIWQLSTWEEYAARTAYLEKGHLDPYPVLLSHDEKVRVLHESMRLAAVDREGEFYHTVTNNCTNNLLIILNRVLPENRRIKMWTIPYMVYNMRATMPLMVIKSLQKKGILGAEFTDINAGTLHTQLP